MADFCNMCCQMMDDKIIDFHLVNGDICEHCGLRYLSLGEKDGIIY